MDVAVSIPDEMFAAAELYARHQQVSRGELYAAALAEYLRRHDEAAVTAALDAVHAPSTKSLDEGLRAATIQTLRRVDW